MRVFLTIGIAVSLLSAAAAFAQQPPPNAPAPPPPPPPAVKVGQPAPDFTLPYLAAGAENRPERKDVRLSDFKGRQNVVLAFFPAAFSPG
ncbi:MAG: redoxin domain-containing protein [Acidobacteria bacterium]|nr:redoxin domain-containing protein [Acidobacteriota bacterium]